MLVDVEITRGLHLQIEAAMTREQLQHVIEKTDAGADLIAPLALEPERQRNLRLGRLSIDYRAAHRTSSMASMQRRVWATMPVAMRIPPSQPGSLDRSRR